MKCLRLTTILLVFAFTAGALAMTCLESLCHIQSRTLLVSEMSSAARAAENGSNHNPSEAARAATVRICQPKFVSKYPSAFII